MNPLELIVSDSEFLASLELERARAAWQKKGYSVEEVAADDAQTVLYAIDTPSLFGGGRMVVVRGEGKKLDSIAERLVAWASAPPDGIAVVLVVTGGAKLRKALAGHAQITEVEAPKPWTVADWLVRHVKGRGRAMTKDAAVALVDAVGTDLRELANAGEQLITSAAGTIGVDTVTRLFRGVESALYTFLEAVLQRDRSAALRHLQGILKSEHPLVVHSALAKQFRAVAVAREAGRGAAPAAIARELDMSVGYVNRATKHARNFDAGEVRRAFRLLADADLALKGGERGEDQPGELVLEMLVAEICGGAPAPARRRR